MASVTRFSVPDISCEHCKTAIERSVGSAEGVERVRVDVASKQVTVQHDRSRTRVEDVIGLIEDQGYGIASFEETGGQ